MRTFPPRHPWRFPAKWTAGSPRQMQRIRMHEMVAGERRGLIMSVETEANGARGRLPARRPAQFDARTRHLVEAPITPTLLRLAAPNVLVMVAQASVGLIETYFVGKLGTSALAGVALVFPVVMLMQMMSAGAMGGGISSAV